MSDGVDREEISVALLGPQARERLLFVLRDRDVEFDERRLVVTFPPAMHWAVQSAYDEAAAGDHVSHGLAERFGRSAARRPELAAGADVGPTIATPARRVGAGAIDYLLISVATLLFALAVPWGSGWVAYLAAEFAVVVAPMALTGRPPGARAMRTIVVTMHDGSVPSWAASITRWIVAHVPLFTVVAANELGGVDAWFVLAPLQYGGLLVVYAGIVAHRLGQGLHDRGAGTLVVMR